MRFRSGLVAALAAVWAVAFAPSAHAQFETRAMFATHNGSRSVLVADFNRDGASDLAVVNENLSSIEILIGNGDGTFELGDTYPLAAPAYYATTASLRHNGILDLVVGAAGAFDVYILLGNGDGTFQAAIAYPTSAEAVMVGIGDFIVGHRNTDLDALEEVPCDCVEVLPGNGDGTFGAPITTPLPYGMSGYAMAIGDFNDDGKPDVVVSGEAFPSYVAAILLGNGDGTFSADGEYAISNVPGSIAVGYFTSNRQNLDLAIANDEGYSVSVLLGDGDGSFQQPAFYGTDFPLWVIAQDLDGDGNIDLAVAGEGPQPKDQPGVSIFKGNGDGTFQSPRFYPAGENSAYVAAGDFNGDGKPDLVLVDGLRGVITTLLNSGIVSFSPTTPLNFKSQAVGTTSAAQTVTLTNTGTTELKIQSMKASAEFAMNSTCGSRVSPGAACKISATFSPTQKGLKTGTISILDNASSKPQMIELLGTGT